MGKGTWGRQVDFSQVARAQTCLLEEEVVGQAKYPDFNKETSTAKSLLQSTRGSETCVCSSLAVLLGGALQKANS